MDATLFLNLVDVVMTAVKELYQASSKIFGTHANFGIRVTIASDAMIWTTRALPEPKKAERS